MQPHDNITSGVALASLTSDLWMPLLQSLSNADNILKGLGIIWLVLQIALKIHAFRKGRNN